MNILFWLYKSRVNKKGLSPVMMRVTLDGQRLNLLTRVDIEETNWDKDRQRIKGNSDLVKAYNNRLLQLKAMVWDYYNNCSHLQKTPQPDEIKNLILGKEETAHTLLGVIDYQINNLKARTNHDIAPSTVKKYQTMRRKVVDFLAQEMNKQDIRLHEVSYQLIFELDTFMRVKQKLHNNGVAKNIQQLKRVIRIAILNEWLDKDPFAKYQCKIIEPKRVHLTTEELQRLEALPLPNERLDKVRDVFVFSCYTGLAYADVAKLNKLHIQQINSQNWIILDRTKTKNQSTIPLVPRAKEILSKWEPKLKDRLDAALLPVISSQNINRYLKEIAQLAHINKRLSFHAARHTFGTTVTLNQGVDITTVSAMLGHKMLKTTQIYAKVNLNKIANDMNLLLKE